MVRGGWGGLAFLTAVLLGTTALAGDRIEIQVTPEADGVRAVYRLPAPVERFEFDSKVEDVRQDTWRAPADMVLAQGVLKRKDGKPFTNFAIQIRPDSAPRDRRYPALTRVGEGWQVYGPYFRSVEPKPPIIAHVAPPKGWIVAPAGPVAKGRAASKTDGEEMPLDGAVFIGPAAYVTKGAAVLVTPPAIGSDLKARIARAADGAMRLYGQRLGVELETAPTVIVTRVPTFNPGWQGDTTDGPVASLRFFGPEESQPETGGQVGRFVGHEFFHFWNNRAFRSRDGDNEAWLHEGMAEYAALLAGREQGDLSEAGVGLELAGRLNGCAAALKSRGLGGDPPKRGGAVYDCGVVAQWSADLKARSSSSGRRDAFDVWRALFADSRAHDQTYDAKGFLAQAGLSEAPEDPLRLLMAPDVEDRWARLTAALNGLGARIVPTRSVDAERTDLLFHLEGLVCQGDHGFYGVTSEGVKLDTTTHCGPLNGDPTVDAAAGHNLLTDALGARDAVVEICAAKGDVAFTHRGKLVATIPCQTAMRPRPLAWTVERWR